MPLVQRRGNNELIAVIESIARTAAEEEKQGKQTEKSADAWKSVSNADSFVVDTGKEFTMDFIETEFRDEEANSLPRFPMSKEGMDCIDNVEVIQIGLETRCDDMDQKGTNDTDAIQQSISQLEYQVHSLSSEVNKEMKPSALTVEKLEQIGLETK